MSDSTATAREWLNTVVEASKELGSATFGFDDVALLGIREVSAGHLNAAYIALIAENSSVQIGISSAAEGCQNLARAMLGMEPGEEDLPPADVADAMAETVNILAGQVKTRMSERGFSLHIGIPICIHGHVAVTEGMDLAVADVRMGHIPVSFMVMQNHKGG